MICKTETGRKKETYYLELLHQREEKQFIESIL